MSRPMRFCPNCGAPIEFRIPEGDDRPRNICSASGDIFYENPRNVVGCLIEQDGAILMARRAIEPRHGFWTLPAGFLELDETTAEGALRETREETGIVAVAPKLFSMVDVPHIGQVHMFFVAEMTDERVPLGAESSEVAFVPFESIVWEQLAFPTVYRALDRYIADRRRGVLDVHVEQLGANDWQAMHLDSKPSMGR